VFYFFLIFGILILIVERMIVLENINRGGKWVENINEFMTVYRYVTGEEEKPRISINCIEAFENSKVYKIAKIYGSGINNNLEPEMESVLEEKLDSLMEQNKIADWSYKFWKGKFLGYAKRVGEIYKKQIDGDDLSIEELIFIYRLQKFKIQTRSNKLYNYISFGSSPDPRMDEVISKRDWKEDFKRFSKLYQIQFLKLYSGNGVVSNDSEVILESGNLECAGDDLLKNPTFIRKFAAKHKSFPVLKYTKPNINNNKKLVLDVLNFERYADTESFSYVSEKLRDDKEVVEVAIRNYGNNIKYASDRLKNEKDIVILALLNDCSVSEENFPLSMLEQYPEIKNIVDIIDIVNVYSKVEDNDVKRVLSNNVVTLIKHSPPQIRNSYKIMKKVFVMNPITVNYASSRIQNKLRK